MSAGAVDRASVLPAYAAGVVEQALVAMGYATRAELVTEAGLSDEVVTVGVLRLDAQGKIEYVGPAMGWMLT